MLILYDVPTEYLNKGIPFVNKITSNQRVIIFVKGVLPEILWK